MMQQNNFYVWAIAGLLMCGEVRSADADLIADLERAALPGATQPSSGSFRNYARRWETHGEQRRSVQKHTRTGETISDKGKTRARRPDTPYARTPGSTSSGIGDDAESASARKELASIKDEGNEDEEVQKQQRGVDEFEG